MKKILFVFGCLLLATGCSIFDTNNSGTGFSPLVEEETGALFETDTTYAFSFLVHRRAASNKEDVIFYDTLGFRTKLDSIRSNIYENTESLAEEYANNPNLVFSQQQLKIFYSIELTDFLKDTTYIHIENRADSDTTDTTYYHLTENFVDSVYTEAGIVFHESADVVINVFNHKDEAQQASHERFKKGITASDLEWLPNNSFAPLHHAFLELSRCRCFWRSYGNRKKHYPPDYAAVYSPGVGCTFAITPLCSIFSTSETPSNSGR